MSPPTPAMIEPEALEQVTGFQGGKNQIAIRLRSY